MKILFFAPHAAVWRHAFPEALVAESLAQRGHEIAYVGCGALLDMHCIPMSANGLRVDDAHGKRLRICRTCQKNDSVIRKEFRFTGPTLDELVSNADRDRADQLLSQITPENCLELEVDGVEVGRFAMYEMLLDAKKSTLSFNDAEWNAYRGHLRNVLLVQFGMDRFLRARLPDRLVVYNALYSVNRTVCRLAERLGIPQYFLHAGGNLSNRLSSLILARGHTLSFYEHMRRKWAELSVLPCSQKSLRAVTDHFLEVTRGRSNWAYSAPPGREGLDLQKLFGLDGSRKVICAIMSSNDERFSAETVGALRREENLLFPAQVQWIQALIEYVKGRRDLALIVRVHPRELSVRDGGKLSAHATMLQEVLSDLPENVKINWPGDSVSLYDIASFTDVFVSAWSSSGKEMALLGLPVVLYSKDLVVYPPDLNLVATTLGDYFETIDKALSQGWSSEWIRKAYRWCAMEYGYSLLDISDSYDKKEGKALSLPVRVAGRIRRLVAPYAEQRWDCRDRASRLSEGGRIEDVLASGSNSVVDFAGSGVFATLEEEAAWLKLEVGRLVRGIYGSSPGRSGGRLAARLLEYAGS